MDASYAITHDSNLKYYAELEPELEEVHSAQDGRQVSSETHDWTVATLRDKLDHGLIDLQSRFQHHFIWDLRPELQSQLIESLLLKIPIPPLYFMLLRTGKIEVVDGQQRLATFNRFVMNQFPLQTLQRLCRLNGMTFRELPVREQERILEAPIHCIVINAGTNPELRYEVFERLNRGSLALTDQEVRDYAYRGPFRDLLAALEMDEHWRRVKGDYVPEPRLVEREMILRFFALMERIDRYGGNLKRFLNDYMGEYAPRDVSRVAELGDIFRQAMRNVYTVFGDNAARLYAAVEGQPARAGAWQQEFSISALDIQASALIGYPHTRVQAAATRINEAYRNYVVTNPRAHVAITRRPASAEATKTRWLGFRAIVLDIMTMTGTSPRGGGTDPLNVAKKLFLAGRYTAAGNEAGDVLERHLKQLCARANLALDAKQTTMTALNAQLVDVGVYDAATNKRIAYLADIRNRCNYATDNLPKPDDVFDLIDGTGMIIQGFPWLEP